MNLASAATSCAPEIQLHNVSIQDTSFQNQSINSCDLFVNWKKRTVGINYLETSSPGDEEGSCPESLVLDYRLHIEARH